jgi:DNA invertase Pin-like site-specific DNA recombinase
VKATPHQVIGYVRCSTTEQADSGLGLAAQEAAIRSECERRGWQLLDLVADEGESGKSLDRPGLQSVLQRIAIGEANGMVAAKLDRISRSVGDFAALLEWFRVSGALLVAIDVGVDTSSPGGKLVANIFSVVSEWERDVIARRTRDGLAELRARGKAISRAAVADNPKLAGRSNRLREGGKTYQQIADALNKSKVPTLRGAPRWTVSSVRGAAGYRRPPSRKQAAVLPAVGRGRPRWGR